MILELIFQFVEKNMLYNAMNTLYFAFNKLNLLQKIFFLKK